jgi:uncharacterized protein (TIGR04141 family)
MKLSFNAYLLQESVIDPSDAISVEDFISEFYVPIGNEQVGQLYYGASDAVPDWFSTLAGIASVQENLRVASAMGVLTAHIDKRWMLVCFGHGWQKVDRLKVVRNFGIRCTLNISVRNALRGIRRDRIASQTIQAIEQIPDSDDISRFGMDVYRDLLRGVKAGVDPAHGFGSSVSGADGFKATIDLGSESIFEYLKRCLDFYSKNSYKNNFKWVDNIYPIRDQALGFRLFYDLMKAIKNNPDDFVFCVPTLVSWDAYDIISFERKKPKSFPVSYNFTVSSWLYYLKGKKLRLGFSSLYHQRAYLYNDAGATAGSWPVFECIHGTLDYNNSTYVIHGGEWFCLDRDYVKEVEDQLAQVLESKFSLPEVGLKESEPQYNERITKDSGGELFKLDANLVQHGQKGSKIEVCDILSRDCVIACVKPWGKGSSSLSHLFQQAVVACKLIVNDKVFVNKVADKLSGDFSIAWNLICDEKDIEVVLAVLRGPAKEKLPFFAKLALVTCANNLREMRFNPTYLPVAIKK